MEQLKQSTAYAVFKNFEKISQIPRCSNDEEKISEFIYDFGKRLGLDTKRDDTGNVLIVKPASPSFEGHDPVILQAHLDMVCEKTEDSLHNFTCDPIDIVIDGDFIKAKDTTLGADDGAGVALMMAILEDNKLEHPKLECIFTTTEETGMDGALALSDQWLTGKNLINLDNEEDWIVIVGCAGGINAYLDLDLNFVETRNLNNFQIKVSGLRGGHSGSTIGEVRLNAIKLLDSLLIKLQNELPLKLSKIEGGSKHNAIPSMANAIIGVEAEDVESLKEHFEAISLELKDLYLKRELDLEFTLEEVEKEDDLYIDDEQAKLILRSLSTFPHGVNSYDKELNIVRSSNNLAKVRTTEGSFYIETSIRSSHDQDLEDLKDAVKKQAELYGYKIRFSEGYPMWKPEFETELLDKAVSTYKSIRNEDMEVLVIHAGLETGILSQKYPDVHMIAMGPTITGAHTPNEQWSISSTEFIFEYLKTLLKNL